MIGKQLSAEDAEPSQPVLMDETGLNLPGNPISPGRPLSCQVAVGHQFPVVRVEVAGQIGQHVFLGSLAVLEVREARGEIVDVGQLDERRLHVSHHAGQIRVLSPMVVAGPANRVDPDVRRRVRRLPLDDAVRQEDRLPQDSLPATQAAGTRTAH